MNCNHDEGVCDAYPFRDDLSFEEFVDRLLHFLGQRGRRKKETNRG